MTPRCKQCNRFFSRDKAQGSRGNYSPFCPKCRKVHKATLTRKRVAKHRELAATQRQMRLEEAIGQVLTVHVCADLVALLKYQLAHPFTFGHIAITQSQLQAIQAMLPSNAVIAYEVTQ